MSIKVKGKPSLQGKIIPHLVVKNGPQSIEFLAKVLGAQELYRSTMPDGRFIHAEVKVLESVVMVAEESPMNPGMKSPLSLGGTAVTLDLYVEDVDAIVARAVEAGGKVVFPVADMFWGDRYGQVMDPSGHVWALSCDKEQLTPEEVKGRMMQAFGQPKKQ
jgi:PhnB protein